MSKNLQYYADKWLRIGLSTKEINQDDCIKAGNALYVAHGMDKPLDHLFVQSIHQLALLVTKLKDDLPKTKDKAIKIIAELQAKPGKHGKTFRDIFGGRYSAFAVGRGDAYLNGDDSDYSKKGNDQALRAMVDLALVCGGFAYYDDFVVYAESAKTVEIADGTKDYLHNPTGPAIEWRCGYKAYYYDNRCIPSAWITDEVTVPMIIDAKNEEDKRILIELYSPEKFLSECTLLDSSDWGELYAPPGKSIVDYLRLKNSTSDESGKSRYYVLNVFKGHKTAEEAVASTFGMGVNDYSPNAET